MLWMAIGGSIYPIRNEAHLKIMQAQYPKAQFFQGTAPLPASRPKRRTA